MSMDRIYQVVNHHGTVEMTTFDAAKAFEEKLRLQKEKNTNRFEVLSYPVKGDKS